MTREEAIRLSKLVWERVADGRAENRSEAIAQLSSDVPEKIYACDGWCPLCEYTREGIYAYANCAICPYFMQYRIDCVEYPNYEDNPVEFAKRIMELK